MRAIHTPELLEMLDRVVSMCESIGDFRNGVTDPNGTIDEGEVRAGELLCSARALLDRTTTP